MAQNDLVVATASPSESALAAVPYLGEVAVGDSATLLAEVPAESIHMIASSRSKRTAELTPPRRSVL